MIILDTNVLSELMRPAPEAAVMDWVAAYPATRLYTTILTQAEILSGVALLANGRRREALSRTAKAMFADDFSGRVLPLNAPAAEAYGEIVAERRNLGRPISQFDALIAAIARSRGAEIATRNIKDFEGLHIGLHDPFGR